MRIVVTILGVLVLLFGLGIGGIFALALAEANAAISSGNAVAGSTYGDAVLLTVFGFAVFIVGIIITVVGIRGHKKIKS